MMYPDIELPSIKWRPFMNAVQRSAQIYLFVGDDSNFFNNKRVFVIQVKGKEFWKGSYTNKEMLEMPEDYLQQIMDQERYNAFLQFLNSHDWKSYWEIPDGK